MQADSVPVRITRAAAAAVMNFIGRRECGGEMSLGGEGAGRGWGVVARVEEWDVVKEGNKKEVKTIGRLPRDEAERGVCDSLRQMTQNSRHVRVNR